MKIKVVRRDKPALEIASKAQQPHTEKEWQLRISQSALHTFQDCRQKAAYKRAGWRPKKPSRALIFGDFWHNVLKIMTHYSKRRGFAPSLKEIEQFIDDEFTTWQAESEHRNDKETVENLYYDVQVMFVLLKYYVKQYPGDFNGKREWIELEDKFEATYAGQCMLGYLDGAYRDTLKKDWILERKTKSQIPESSVLVDFLAMDLQTHMYVQAYNIKYGKFPAGITYDIVRKPSIRKKDSEKMIDFLKRLEADIAKKPESYFVRVSIAVNKALEKTWAEENLGPLLNEYAAWVAGKLPTYRNTGMCESKYGACEFLPMCANGDTRFFKKIDYNGRKKK